MRRALLTLPILVLASACAVAPSEPQRSDVYEATQRWASSFNSCDIDRLVSLYDNDALIWGTASAHLISTPLGIQDYYARICAMNPRPTVVLGDQVVRRHGDTAVNSGVYTFTVYTEAAPHTVAARFSFAYHWHEGRWLIVEQHSSMIPTPITLP